MNMIAKTILEQIGGRRFAAMTGSKDFIDMGNGLRMSLARNKTSANRLDIIYDAGADLYNMRFYRNARGDILRYAGGNVHDGDGALHPFLRGGRRKPPYFLSVSMMADKESSKETSVPIFDKTSLIKI